MSLQFYRIISLYYNSANNMITLILFIFDKMKKALLIIFFQLFLVATLSAQGDDFALARQFAANGEQQKALEIYQKLFKQESETYYPYYVTTLLALKKFDDAETVTKKLLHKHPGDYRYSVS